MRREYYPTVTPRGFTLYGPPQPLPTREAEPRAAYEDARRFIQRCARVVARQTTVSIRIIPRATREPAEPPDTAIQRAVRRLTEGFGEPSIGPKPGRAFIDWEWGLPIERAGEVVDFLGRLVEEWPEEASHVTVALGWVFFLRDLGSGKTLPFQQRKYRPSRPQISQLGLTLGRESRGDLLLVFPFEQPDERLRHYVLALQEHAPTGLDPRYFDRFVPREVDGGFERIRLPPGWLAGEDIDLGHASAREQGSRVAGSGSPSEMRSDAVERSAPLAKAVDTVRTALMTHAYRAVVVTGPSMLNLAWIAERAAKTVGLQLSEVDCVMLTDAQEVEPAVASAIAGFGAEPAVLVLDGFNVTPAPVRSLLQEIVRTRTAGRTALPPSVRVVVTNSVTSRTTDASMTLQYRAQREGFLPDAVLREWSRDLHIAMAREITVTFIQWDSKLAG